MKQFQRSNRDIKSLSHNYDSFNNEVNKSINSIEDYSTFIITKQHKRPDLAAKLLYDDPELFWVLLVYNGLTSMQFTEGRVIRVPSKPDVLKILASHA